MISNPICPFLTIYSKVNPVLAECMGEDCAMWCIERDCCGLRVLSPSEVHG